MEIICHRVMKYSRWVQYVHYFYPEKSIVRPKEDECDGCYAINTALSNPNITAERCAGLEELKKTCISAAI